MVLMILAFVLVLGFCVLLFIDHNNSKTNKKDKSIYSSPILNKNDEFIKGTNDIISDL